MLCQCSGVRGDGCQLCGAGLPFCKSLLLLGHTFQQKSLEQTVQSVNKRKKELVTERQKERNIFTCKNIVRTNYSKFNFGPSSVMNFNNQSWQNFSEEVSDKI